MEGNDTLQESSGNNLFNGAAGDDGCTGGTGNKIFIASAGKDTIIAGTGTGADLIVFNRRDGQDRINASTGVDNTLSLGGGISYTDLSLRKSANDLIWERGNSESITRKDWYSTTNNNSVVNLQMIASAMADCDATGSDALHDNKVEQFHFAGLVDRFDQARAANPALTSWTLTNALPDFYRESA